MGIQGRVEGVDFRQRVVGLDIRAPEIGDLDGVTGGQNAHLFLFRKRFPNLQRIRQSHVLELRLVPIQHDIPHYRALRIDSNHADELAVAKFRQRDLDHAALTRPRVCYHRPNVHDEIQIRVRRARHRLTTPLIHILSTASAKSSNSSASAASAPAFSAVSKR